MARNWISTTTSRFLSTLSLRRATALDRLKSQATVISIHALLAESDGRTILSGADISDFYPRSPCGERLSERVPLAELTSISIHALLAESDCHPMGRNEEPFNFYPRSPCGERLRGQRPSWGECQFLSTLSLRRATRFQSFH